MTERRVFSFYLFFSLIFSLSLFFLYFHKVLKHMYVICATTHLEIIFAFFNLHFQWLEGLYQTTGKHLGIEMLCQNQPDQHQFLKKTRIIY